MSTPEDLGLRRLLATLGVRMVSSGQPVDEIEHELAHVARVLGAPHAQLGVGPTGVHVALDVGQPATFQSVTGGLRLEQSAEVRVIRHQLVTGELSVETAMQRLDDVPRRPPAYPRWLMDLGFVLVGVGICLILQPGWANVLAAAFTSLVVVFIADLVKARPALTPLLAPATGFIAALIVLTAVQWELIDGALRTMLPALAVLLPGALIVTGLFELAAGAMLAGTGRLLYGTVQLLLFAVGIGAAAALLGVPGEWLGNIRVDQLGAWAAPVGLILIGVGIALMECVPLRPLPWVFGVLAVTFLVQYGGQTLGAPVFGSFLGAIAASVGASLAEALDRDLARLVVFLPSFWLLVPGSLGLLGVSEVGVAASGSTPNATQVPAVVLAIAVGLLVGALSVRAAKALTTSKTSTKR